MGGLKITDDKNADHGAPPPPRRRRDGSVPQFTSDRKWRHFSHQFAPPELDSFRRMPTPVQDDSGSYYSSSSYESSDTDSPRTPVVKEFSPGWDLFRHLSNEPKREFETECKHGRARESAGRAPSTRSGRDRASSLENLELNSDSDFRQYIPPVSRVEDGHRNSEPASIASPLKLTPVTAPKRRSMLASVTWNAAQSHDTRELVVQDQLPNQFPDFYGQSKPKILRVYRFLHGKGFTLLLAGFISASVNG